MAWTETRYTDADDLLGRLRRDARHADLVCRGQSQAAWGILPSIDRAKGIEGKTGLAFEWALIARFQALSYFLPVEERRLARPVIETIQLMRHYGAPTRLVDWSRSPYVAAYFAALEHDDEDGAIWMFSMGEFSKRQSKERVEQHRAIEEATNKIEWVDSLLRHSLALHLVHPDIESPRMFMQQGVFTLGTSLPSDHAAAIEETLPAERRTKLLVAGSIKRPLRHALEAMNVFALPLFPGPEGLGRYLTQVHIDHSRIGLDGDLLEHLGVKL